MAEFQYKARDPAGRIKTGTIKGSSKAVVKSQLARMRFRVISINSVGLDSPSKGAGGDEEAGGILGKFIFRDDKGNIQIRLGVEKPTSKDLIIFTKQFATMIASGVAMIQSLGILASQQRVKSFGKVLENVRNAVENGATLSEALEAYPKLFDTLYVSMVRAGEASGSLDGILLKLVTYIEKAEKIKSQVKSAMMYPAIVIVVAFTVVTGLLAFVVPMFAKQYTDSGKELPELTAIIIAASDFLLGNFHYLIASIALSYFSIKRYIATPDGRKRFDALMLKLPGIGELLRKIAVGRFCSTMATMLTSGVNLLEALDICAASSGNTVIEQFVLNIRTQIEQGKKFSEPLGEKDIFPPMVVSMVAVGEATGALDSMLSKVSEFYEDEVDLAVKTLLSMIEPIMIVVIGGIVGFIVIAMYLPVFDMGAMVG